MVDAKEKQFVKVLSRFTPEEKRNFIYDVVNAVYELGVNEGDERVTFSCGGGNWIALTIGQRYCIGLSKRSDERYGFIAEEEGDESDVRYGEFEGKPAQFGRTMNHQRIADHWSQIVSASRRELERTTRSSFRKFSNPFFEKAVFDPDYRAMILDEVVKPNMEKTTDDRRTALNTILYGPPGTGKTYGTIAAALKICDPSFFTQNQGNDNALRKRFNELSVKKWEDPDWQIAFCTFHQSFSYEDFVEGIKPLLSEEESSASVQYEIRSGILKRVARRAEVSMTSGPVITDVQFGLSKETFERSTFYKMSLGAKYSREDAEVYNECIRDNVIALGYLDQFNVTGKSDREISELPTRPDQSSSSASQVSYFSNHLKVGDLVIITHGNLTVRAIARVKGEYRYEPERDPRYPHVRDVEWLLRDENIPYEEVSRKQFIQRGIYKLRKEDLKSEFFILGVSAPASTASRKNYVLIIDEINRGNVSGIFGELITLIEENKRKGSQEALEVLLPYSQELFSIPDNLHIIGTMNTADRSVEALDTALRRRFSFVECPSRPELLRGKKAGGIDLEQLLATINARIEMLLDRDHHIGHSYFMNWDGTDPELKLRTVFRNNIIPLLQEYFYGDPVKVGLVLGEAFVVTNGNAVKFAKFIGADDIEPKTRYRLVDPLEKDANVAYMLGVEGFREIVSGVS